MKRILLLSAYDADSHRRWRSGLVEHLSEFRWTVLTLPPRHFSWRIRGNSLSWAFEQHEVLQQHFDLVIATSMVDLSALRGFVPSLASVPALVYFHENQFAYPESNNGPRFLEPRMVNLYTALCADKILFNSRYNRRTFFDGVEQLLARMPDQVPAGIGEFLQPRSEVLPVPLEERLFTHAGKATPTSASKPLTIVWNHRWEYDKGPDRLLRCIQKLPDSLSFCFHIVGQQFRQAPPEFDSIRDHLQQRGWLGQWGYIEHRSDYLELLRQSDVVLSTSLHDFQGLAVQEAMALGCLPVVPNRLAYPEYFAGEFCYESFIDEPEREAQSAANWLMTMAQNQAGWSAPDLHHLSWHRLAPQYEQLIQSCVASGSN